ncbi:MAG: metal-binding protein [Catenulispora sp. 13_1_20CM_3_70_7]|nr:MAG: metal-binding protein [Catenulispora sp. 13_1_20CM_3_70_7]
MIDTHEYARRPGSMRTVHDTVPAPDLLGDAKGLSRSEPSAEPTFGIGRDGVAVVPPGSDVQLDLRLEAVVEGVLATGTARAAVVAECVRCLEPLDLEVEAEFQELYFFPGEDTGGDEDAVFLVNDLLDLEPVVHDAVVLALPPAPLCREDCLGLCPECGALLNEDPEHEHETVDPRWAALADLKDQEDSNSGTAPVAPPAQDHQE